MRLAAENGEGAVRRFLKLPLLLVALATTVFAAGPDEAGVKSVIQQFQQSGVQGAGRAFQVGICEGRHRCRDGVGIYQTNDRRDRERRQARRLLGLVCLRPSESRIYVEGGFVGLERKAAWSD